MFENQKIACSIKHITATAYSFVEVLKYLMDIHVSWEATTLIKWS
jgi:hypothetical protein